MIDMEKRRERDRRYYAAHTEERRAYARKYHEAHIEEVREYNRRHYEERVEEKREWQRKYNREHAEQRRVKERQYRLEHPEVSRKYHEEHAAERREYDHRVSSTEHRKAICKAHNLRRRVQLGGELVTAEIFLELKAERCGMCPYCGKQIITGHFDHVVPISKGGTNARENILWVCATCNLQKQDSSLVEFLMRRESA